MSTKQPHKGLGKGFDTLLPQDFDDSILLDSSERIQKIALKDISANSEQPRKHFDETAINELASSIKQYGVLQPLVVTSHDDGYQIIAGERRWRAAKKAGLSKVPVIVRSSEQLERLEISLVENVQRVDLSPLEQAASIEKLHQQFNMEYSDIAKKLGKAITTINNIVRLLHLPEEAKQALHENRISEGHARSILALKSLPEKQQELLENIQKYNWSVRHAEQFVIAAKQAANNSKSTNNNKTNQPTSTKQTERLSKIINTPVSIKRTSRGGRIEIYFSNDDECTNILQTLTNKNNNKKQDN